MLRKGKLTDIHNKDITKKVSIGNQSTQFVFGNALVGKVNGKEEILDEVIMDNLIDGIASVFEKNHSKYLPIPKQIVINNELNEEKRENLENKIEKGIIESYLPRYKLDQVVLNKSIKEKINICISAAKYRKRLCDEWGMADKFGANRAIVLNFYGKPGTGKSMAAEAIASSLGKKVYHINYADLESKYVGETPKNIRSVFEKARADEALLVFDEADSFLGKRLTSVTQSADYGVNITRSVLLMEIERFNGIVVFTTNLIKNYDEAFKRRILLSVNFDMPDEQAREQIWDIHLGDKIPLAKDIDSKLLAKKYDSISGADIRDMVFYAALYSIEGDRNELSMEALDKAYEVIRERYVDKSELSDVKVLSTEKITEEEYKGLSEK